MQKILRSCGLLAVLLLCFISTAQAEEMIFRLRPEAALCSLEAALPGDVAPVWEAGGIYVTEDTALIEELLAAGRLEYAEPNAPVELQYLPDDPKYTGGSQWELDMVGMDYAWRNGFTGQRADGTRVRVGVIDSGLNADHRDLAEVHIIPGKNYCDLSNITDDTTDDQGHGTFVSGIISATANNGLDIAGIAPGVELVPLKCFSTTGGTMANVAAAVIDAVDVYHCDVLNLSLGGTSNNSTLKAAIDYAESKGVIVVAAVGNLNSISTGEDVLYYPAAWDTVIGVGSVDKTKTVSWFSRQNSSVYLTAPGGSVTSLLHSSNSGTRTNSGTSFAAPVVTAAVALALSADPDLTRAEITTLLADSCQDLGEPGYDEVYGHGLLDLDVFLAAALQDEADLVLYPTEEGVELSAWRPAGGSLLAAVYDDRGILRGLHWAGTGSLHRWLLPETGFAAIRLFRLDTAAWAPLGPMALR